MHDSWCGSFSGATISKNSAKRSGKNLFRKEILWSLGKWRMDKGAKESFLSRVQRKLFLSSRKKRKHGKGNSFVYKDFYIFKERVLVKANSEKEAKKKFTEIIGA